VIELLTMIKSSKEETGIVETAISKTLLIGIGVKIVALINDCYMLLSIYIYIYSPLLNLFYQQ